jgi:hypothetical protein
VINKGIVNRVSSKQVVNSHLKSFVKGSGGSTISLASLSLLSSYKRIQFNSETFDENNDYNTTTYEFTAPSDGIYNVYVQYEMSSLVAASTAGVAIFSERSGVAAIEAQESYLSVGVTIVFVSTNVSPPTRKAQTLVKLNAGDKIYFGAAGAASLSLIGGDKSFFTIHQVY